MGSFWELFFEGVGNARVLYVYGALIYIIIKLIIGLIGQASYMLDRRDKPPIGKHFKEKPMDTVTVKFCTSQLEMHKDAKAERIKEQYDLRMFYLGYESPREVTKNKSEAVETKKANEERLLEFVKAASSMLAENSPCLFDRYGYVSEYKGEGAITDLSKHADRSFCLDGDEGIRAWLEGQEKIVNTEGQTIGVRGIDAKTVEQLSKMPGADDYKVSELIIPNISEEILCQMSLTQLLMFCDIKNCKFKINNGAALKKCCFEYSQTPGYTAMDICGKIQELAESKGYKFKVIE